MSEKIGLGRVKTEALKLLRLWGAARNDGLATPDVYAHLTGRKTGDRWSMKDTPLTEGWEIDWQKGNDRLPVQQLDFSIGLLRRALKQLAGERKIACLGKKGWNGPVHWTFLPPEAAEQADRRAADRAEALDLLTRLLDQVGGTGRPRAFEGSDWQKDSQAWVAIDLQDLKLILNTVENNTRKES